MSWLDVASLCSAVSGAATALYFAWRSRQVRKQVAPLVSRVDQLHADLHAREPAKVIVGPWMLETTCPACSAKFERPRIVTDERCEPCKAKAWHEQELADRDQWEKAPGRIKMPDGKEVVMSDALIIRKDWGK